MAKIHRFPSKEEVLWQRTLEPNYRESLRSRAVPDRFHETILSEFKLYWREMRSDFAASFSLNLEHPLSDSDEQALRKEVAALMEAYEESHCDRIGIAQGIILDLLAEKHVGRKPNGAA